MWRPEAISTALLMAAIFLGLLTLESFSGERVALVIGNSEYGSLQTLPNPRNDAGDIRNSLERIGFKVTLKENLNYEDFRRTLQEFGREAGGAEIGLFFFAGHGVEVNNENFLIPSDARLAADSDVEFEAIPVSLIMNALSGVSGVRIVLLDACRDNPFLVSMKRTSATRSVGRGLAKIEPITGTLVGYAAKEGTVAYDGAGRNSPYTAGLLEHLEERNLDIQFVFRKVRDSVMVATGGKQEPFTYGSLPGKEIYLAPSRSDGQPDPQATEIEYWSSVKDTRDRKALESYIATYPDGAFVRIARLKIEQLDSNESPQGDASAVASLARQIQLELARVGCEVGQADGIWGNRSQRALGLFSEQVGLNLPTDTPTTFALRELGRHEERVCPRETTQPSKRTPQVASEKTTSKPTVRSSVTTRSSSVEASAGDRICRTETIDECRKRARAAGARKGSGFCRDLRTVCN
ncbi:MAG: caspase family protein [Rhizobiaceae bacterium]|nr:caspase family protein [Rhizobiaceae bacterium]